MSGLRVLMLGPLGPPHVEDQALGLVERGVELRVGGDAPPELDYSGLVDAGIAVSEAPAPARATPWGMAATVRWVRRLLAEAPFDVVHAHWVPGFGFAAALAGASPLAITAWGSDVYRAGRGMRMANRVALRRADLVMADSGDLLARCVALGADPARTEVVQWGVDLRTFSPAASEDERGRLKRELGLGPGPVLLSPRSFMPVYNIPSIIDAFGMIGERHPDAQLVLKHMGPQRIELPELPHPDRVRIVGNVPYGQMPDYYRVADACISLTSSDSSPRSVWEAMGCAAPCVVSDLPWVSELLTPGRDVVTVPIDAGALADAVGGLLADPGRARGIGEAGRALIADQLDRDREMDRLVELYRGMVDGR